MANVYFIGAGPGDVELLTLKAKNIIEKADVVIYADSLINPQVCDFARKDARIHKSASLTLEETTEIIADAVKENKTVARLHSGDPSIYGAIGEQMAFLDKLGIEYEVIPGISSLFAAAAALKTELTVPEISQTVIITRMKGRTDVPEAENLKSLAAHGSTIAVFLSTSLAEEVVDALVQGGYHPDTPAALVYKASWKDEKIIKAALKDLPAEIKKSNIKKQALILVGRFLNFPGEEVRSKLYDQDFKHEYRK